MGNPLEDVDTSDQPYVVVSSDTHAGLQVEAYRDYLDAKFLPQFVRSQTGLGASGATSH